MITSTVEVYVRCDRCKVVYPVEAQTKDAAWREVKPLGWRSTARWEHLCPACCEKMEKVGLVKKRRKEKLVCPR